MGQEIWYTIHNWQYIAVLPNLFPNGEPLK